MFSGYTPDPGAFSHQRKRRGCSDSMGSASAEDPEETGCYWLHRSRGGDQVRHKIWIRHGESSDYQNC